MLKTKAERSIQRRPENSMNRELAAIIAGALMPSLDTTIVSIGISSLMEAFQVSEAAVQWVSTAYLLALAVAIPAIGWAEERFGGRKCWMSGLVVFLIGSGLCAASPTLGALVACRVIQGFGAGALITLLTSLPVEIARSRGITAVGGIMSTVMLPLSLGPILGPVLGGVVLSLASWHWLFLINLPVGALAIFFSLRWLGADADGVRPEQPRHFDLPGFVLIAGAISALLLGLTGVSQGEGLLHPAVGLPLLAGLGLLALFAALPSTRDPARAIVDVSLFRHHSVTAASCAMFFAGGTLYAAQFLFPLYWQRTLGSSALEAALMLLPQGVGALLTRTAAGKLTDAHGGRVVATGGFLACVITTIPFLFLGNSAGILLYLILFVRGLAIGMLIVPITTSAFRGLPDGEVSRATVIIRACQQVGGSFGTAAVAATAASAAQSGGQAAAEAPGDFMASFLVLAIVSAAGAAASLTFPFFSGPRPSPRDHASPLQEGRKAQ